jgi:hypothetical protein
METASLSPAQRIKSTQTKSRSVFAISDTTSLTEFAIDAPRARFTTAKLKPVKIQLRLFAVSMNTGMNAAASANSDTLEFQESA